MIAYIAAVILPNVVFAMEVEVIPGAYLQQLPNTSFYESSIPVIFYIPNQRNACLEFCQNSDACNEFPEKFLPELTTNSTLLPQNTEQSVIKFDGDILEYKIVTKSHAKHLFVLDADIQAIRDRLKQYKVFPKNYVHCHQPKSSSNNIHPTVETKSELKDIILHMCQEKKLSLNIISFETLHLLLTNAIKLIENENFILALPSLSEYYSLPLIDCTLSAESGMFAIYVPIIRRDLKDLSHWRLISPTFAWNDFTCATTLTSLDIAVSSTHQIFLTHCDPIKDDLCLITESFEQDIQSIQCARAILTGATTGEMDKYCPITCRQSGWESKIVTQLDNTRYVISRASSQIRIYCPNGNYSFDDDSKIGSVLMTAPCKCRIHMADGPPILPRFPCYFDVKDVKVRKIIPSSWSKLKSFKILPMGERQPIFNNIDECLDADWISNQRDLDEISIVVYVLIAVNSIFMLIFIIWGIRLCLNWKRQSQRRNIAKSQTSKSQSQKHLPMPFENIDLMDDGYLRPINNRSLFKEGNNANIYLEIEK